MDQAISVHEALIYTMIAMSAVDRQISETEYARIGEIVRRFPVFRDYDLQSLVKTAEACGNKLSEGLPVDDLLEMIADALPAKLHETAYALAVDVATADFKVTNEELRLLELLRNALGLDKLVCAAIERSARARNQML